jgi:hypothetical protein
MTIGFTLGKKYEAHREMFESGFVRQRTRLLTAVR